VVQFNRSSLFGLSAEEINDESGFLKTSDSATACAGGTGEADTDKHAVAKRVQRTAMHTSWT
jgi:hypothetical protein